uniref:Uncharacterized protein n=1 Tax=Sinocyclocheilus anshuiensis TaxID=1608454 RepID=A0A671PZH5_9TELE
MAPFSVIDLFVPDFDLDAPGAHVHEQVEEAFKQLHGKEVNLWSAVFGTLQPAVAEQQEAVGFGGSEVEGHGTGFLGVPARKGYVSGRRVETDGV